MDQEALLGLGTQPDARRDPPGTFSAHSHLLEALVFGAEQVTFFFSVEQLVGSRSDASPGLFSCGSVLFVEGGWASGGAGMGRSPGSLLA